MSLLLSIVAASPRRTSVTVDDWFEQSDSTVSRFSLSRVFDDPIIQLDGVLSEVRFLRSVEEDLTVSDPLISFVVRTFAYDEALLLVDEFIAAGSVPGGYTVTLEDVLELIDVIDTASVRGVIQDDPIPMSDVSSQPVYVIRTLDEAMALLDSVSSSTTSPGAVSVVSLSDSLVIFDAGISYILSSRLAEDAFLTADETLLSKLRSSYVQDSITLDDVLLSYALRVVAQDDLLTTSDSTAGVSSLVRSLLDSLVYDDLADVLYIPGSGLVYDVRIRITRVEEGMRLGHDSPLTISTQGILALSHDVALSLGEETSLVIGGY